MNRSIASPGHDVRPHPSARAGPPVSAAGRRWLLATVLGGPLLVVALLVLPGVLLADRLYPGAGDNGFVYAAIWTPIAAASFAFLLRAQFRRAASEPAALWGWVVPAVYMVAGLFAGPHLAKVLTSLDQPGPASPAWDGFAVYGSIILGTVAGSLLAQRVAEHLPRAPVPRTRTAWVETVPAMGAIVVAYHLVLLTAMVGFMSWVDGSPWFGLAAGLWVVAVNLWVTSVRVAVTPGGVRVAQGPFGLVGSTRVVPITDIASAEAVEVSTRQIFRRGLCGDLTFYVFRPGPALRLETSSGTAITIGTRSDAHARQAAELLAVWRHQQPAT